MTIFNNKFKRYNKIKYQFFDTLFNVCCFICLILWVFETCFLKLPDIVAIITVVILVISFAFKMIFRLKNKQLVTGISPQKARWLAILLLLGTAADIYILGVISIFENISILTVFILGNLMYYLILKKLFISTKK